MAGIPGSQKDRSVDAPARREGLCLCLATEDSALVQFWLRPAGASRSYGACLGLTAFAFP